MRRAIDFGFKTVQIGIRDYSREEYEFAQENNLKIFEWGLDAGNASVDEIIASIETEDVYLTIDIDGLDPSVMPATGTPVPGGLDWNYASKLIRELSIKKNVISADIVEVAPRDGDVLTQYAAAQMCYNIISYNCLRTK
jgi:agmatinase